MAGAPRPGQESGRIADAPDRDSTGRKLGRALLWIPRLPFELLAQPVRGLTYVQSRYDPIGTVQRWFTFDDSYIAAYPSAGIVSGFGAYVGVQASLLDVLGRGERIRARASFGGEFDYLTRLEIDSGERIGKRAAVSVQAEARKRPRDRFYGIGNGDEVIPTMPVSPLVDDLAVETKFREEVLRAILELRFQPRPTLLLTVTNAILDKEFEIGDPVDGVTIDEAYILEDIPKFVEGARFTYHELDLAWDTRHAAEYYDPSGLHSAGGLLAGFAGVGIGVGDDTRFWRFGIDAQYNVRITDGPRVLQVRGYGELVGGPSEQIPFTELPRLGGSRLLRGYDRDRFRDKVAGLVQVEYAWAMSDRLAGSVFADVGRVWSGLDDLSLAELRVGYGAGVSVIRGGDTLLRGMIASTIDGGVFFALSLSPAFELRPRAERY